MPDVVKAELGRHIDEFGLGPDLLLFRNAQDRAIRETGLRRRGGRREMKSVLTPAGHTSFVITTHHCLCATVNR